VKRVADHLAAALGDMLLALGVTDSTVRRELTEMRESVFKPTNSRSVLGSVNDFAKSVKWRLYEEPDADLISVALWLSETPILSLGGKAPDVMTRERLQ
jgi:hypothetical protein